MVIVVGKWTRRHEFKFWTRLIAVHIIVIPFGKVWIQLFSLQVWVNSMADWVLLPWWGNKSRRRKTLNSNLLNLVTHPGRAEGLVNMVSVCVCVWERERDRDTERVRQRQRDGKRRRNQLAENCYVNTEPLPSYDVPFSHWRSHLVLLGSFLTSWLPNSVSETDRIICEWHIYNFTTSTRFRLNLPSPTHLRSPVYSWASCLKMPD